MPSLSLADKIVDASKTGVAVPELTFLDALDNGDTVATGTPVANITDAEEDHTINSTFDDAEVKAALDALGAKINLLIAALEEFQIAAAS